jgi:hypothetical protein
MNINVTVIYFSMVVIAAISGLINFRKEWPVQWKVLLLLNLLSFPVEGWASWLANHSRTNHVIYDKWAPVETIGLLFVLSWSAARNRWGTFSRWVFYQSPGWGLGGRLLWRQENLNTTWLVVFTMFLELMCAVGVLISLVQQDGDGKFSRIPVFWLAGGLLCYACLQILGYTLAQFLWIRHFLPIFVYFFSLIPSFFFYCGYTMSYWTLRKQ